MKYWNSIVKHWKNSLLLLVIVVFSACVPKQKTDAFVYPDSGGSAPPLKEVKTPKMESESAVPKAIKDEIKGDFVPPPLAPQFSKKEARSAQKRLKGVDNKFSYKDKPFKELLESFPFIKIRKLSRLEYLEHEIEMVKETLASHKASEKHFIALDALKEGYLYYIKKSKMYRKISKKLAKNEKLSQKQAALIAIVNNMYFHLSNVLTNESTDYRLKAKAIRYMEEMRGEVIMDFFVQDALENIVSSKDAPPSLIAKAKEILKKNER